MPEIVEYDDPLKGAYPRAAEDLLQGPKIPEVDMDKVKGAIRDFSGSKEEAQGLVNMFIGGKVGRVPKPNDYISNANSYMYDGAADNDAIKNLEHIRTGFIPEEDKEHTSLTDYQDLNTEEQWAKIEKNYLPASGGMTRAGVDPNFQQRHIGKVEQQKYIDDHLSELRSKSRTYKLSTGKGFSDQARHMVNKMTMTKQPPNRIQWKLLTDNERKNFSTYASGRNPKISTDGWNSVMGDMGTIIGETGKDIVTSFEKTGQSIMRSWGGIDDPEELWLRFNAKFKSKFELDEMSDKDKTNMHSWLVDEIKDKYSFFAIEVDKSTASEEADQMMEHIGTTLQKGKDIRLDKKLANMTRAVTRKAFKKEGVTGLALASTEIITDLVAVATSTAAGTAIGGPLVGLGAGGLYTSGRFFGDFEETLLDGGVDPRTARTTSLGVMIPYILTEQVQVGQIFGKQAKGALIKVISESGGGKVAQVLAKYGDNITAETLEEVAQELFQEVGKLKDIEGYDSTKIFGNLVETAKQAFEGLLLIGVGSSIKGAAQGDFIEQDISNAIEETQTPLTRKDEEEIGIANLRQEEYDAAEDKEAYLDEQDYSPKVREIVETTQDIQQEYKDDKTQELDELEAAELQEAAPVTEEANLQEYKQSEELKERSEGYEQHANIVEEGSGLRITTKKGIDFKIEFNGDAKTAGEFDPNITTIKLRPGTGIQTVKHEEIHLFKSIGIITDQEFSNLEAKAIEYFGEAEINRIREANIEGYKKQGLVATEETLVEEIVANYFEDLSLKKKIPEDVRKILQKIMDFLKESLRQYIGQSVSGDKMAQLIQSGDILKRKPTGQGKAKMERSAKRREDAQKFEDERGQREFIQSALDEADANNQELISAVEALSNLQQAPDFVKEKLSAKERIEQSTGITRPAENLQAEEFVTGDDIIESELPGDFFQDESEGAGISGDELYGFGETVANPLIEYMDKRTFNFSTEFAAEVKGLSPVEKRKIAKYRDTESAVDSDVMMDELKEKFLIPESDTDTEFIHRLINTKSEIKYSFSPRSERDAAVVLANSIITGKAKTVAQREQILNSYKIPLENQAAIKARAFEIAEQVEQELGSVKNTETIRKAIKKVEIKQFYDAQRKEILTTGIEQGELLTLARQRLKDDRKKAKEASKSNRAALPNMQEKVRSISDDPAMLSFVNNIVEDSNKLVFPNKVPKNWQRDARVLGTIRESVRAAGNHMMRDVKTGADKQKLQQQLKEIFDRSTYNGLRNASEKILIKINNSRIKQTQKELRADFNKALKNYTTEPPKGVEERKRTVAGQKHLLLYWGNKYKGLDYVDYNKKISSIMHDMEEVRDSDNEADRILFNKLEIQHQALIAFGSRDRADAASSDILSAIDFAEAVIKDGKEITSRLEEAHREKYQKDTDNILAAVEAAKPHVKKKDERSRFGSRMMSMNAGDQLRFITIHGTDTQKASLEKILLANDSSKVHKEEIIAGIESRVKKEAADLGIKKLEAYQDQLSKESKSYAKYSEGGRTNRSKADLLTQFMAFRQSDIVENANRTNDSGVLINPILNRQLQQMPDIIKELTAQDMDYAVKVGEVLEELLPDTNKTFKKQYGVDMKVQEENYFPLKVETSRGGFASQMSSVSVAPGFTISRVPHSSGLDERANIFEVFAAHVEDAAHYIATYDSQAGLRTALTNRHFRDAVKLTHGKPTLTMAENSIVDMAVDRSLVEVTQVKEVDLVRSIMSVVALGGNVKSAILPLVGSVNIFATQKGMISKIANSFKDHAAYRESIDIVRNSAFAKNRRERGFNEGMITARSKAKGNKFVRAYVDAAFYPMAEADSLVVNHVGGVIYHDYINSEMVAGLTKEQIHLNGLALAKKGIEMAFQPTSSDFLPADIRRGGSFDKASFQFMTEPKSKLGIYFRDWAGIMADYKKGNKDKSKEGKKLKKKAIKDALRSIVGQNLIVPGAYWFAGELIRSAFDEDELDMEESIRRLGSGVLLGPACGLLIWGTGMDIIAKTLTGDKIFYGGSSVPADRIMQDTGFILKTVTSEKEALEKIDKIAEKYMPVYKYTKKLIEK